MNDEYLSTILHNAILSQIKVKVSSEELDGTAVRALGSPKLSNVR
jgi:hypothetical protein